MGNAKYDTIKKRTGNIDKNATIVAGSVLDSKQVKREVGDPEEFKKVIKNYVKNDCNFDNISVYKFNKQYFVVIGNAYKKNIQKALKAKNKNQLEQCEDVAKEIKDINAKFGSMDVYKEGTNLYLANKDKSVFVLINESVKNNALLKSNRELN